MQVFAKKAIERLENAKGSFWQWAVTAAAFFLIRCFLDIIFEANTHESLKIMPIVKHYFLWETGFYLAIVFLLFFLTRESIIKISKATFVFWPIILIVSPVDSMITFGGYALSYIGCGAHWEKEIWNFFGFFGSKYITQGQTIALILGFALVLVYIFLKTKNLPKTIMGGIGYYSITYFFAALPCFLPKAFYFSLFLLVLLQFSSWVLLVNKKIFFEAIKNFHPLRVVHYVGLCIAGIIVFYSHYGQLALENAAFAVFACFFAFQGALAVNNIYDKKNLKIDKQTYLQLAIFYIGAALILSLLANNNSFLFLISSYLLLSYLYSAPPVRFKKFGFWNNLLIGFESALMFMAGFASQTPDIELMPLNYFFTVFAIFSIASNIKDLKDTEQDKKNGIKTLPVLLGKEKSVKVLALLTSLCFPLSVTMLGWPDLLWSSLLFAAINGILLLKFKTEKTVFACYFLFLASLGAWLLF